MSLIRPLCRTAVSRASTSSQRAFIHSTTVLSAALKGEGDRQRREDPAAGLDFTFNDTSLTGHLMIEEERKALAFMRIVELELPKLKPVPFDLPTKPQNIILQTSPYSTHAVIEGQEPNPTVSLVIPLADLPQSKDPKFVHKVKLLAGDYWSPYKPNGTGGRRREEKRLSSKSTNFESVQGWVKISCDKFPYQKQNKRWCTDVLDDLIAEASDMTDSMADIPHYPQKVYEALAMKNLSLSGKLPTASNMPSEWLPKLEEKETL